MTPRLIKYRYICICNEDSTSVFLDDISKYCKSRELNMGSLKNYIGIKYNDKQNYMIKKIISYKINTAFNRIVL